jgi:hypothetical protein
MLKLDIRRKTNYVMCCWSGPRRTIDQRYIRDSTYYIRKHIRALTRFKHNLAQITLVVNHNPHESQEYRQFLNALPEKIQNAKVEIVHRANIGMSYGAFSEAYGIWRKDFNYYIYIEDDGCFMQHDFDAIMIDFLDKNPKCGYVCGYASAYACMPHHAAISVGMFRSVALEDVWTRLGEIPHAHNEEYSGAQLQGQVGVSQTLLSCGWDVLDMRGKYRVGFRHMQMQVTWMFPGMPSHDENNRPLPPLVGPI